jgi:hypothetical protein
LDLLKRKNPPELSMLPKKQRLGGCTGGILIVYTEMSSGFFNERDIIPFYFPSFLFEL